MKLSSSPNDFIMTLQQGGVIAYPTEAVFGLGCDPLNETAVKRLLALKQRSIEKGLILIASNFAQVAPFLQPLNEQQQACTHPSDTTWVFPANATAPRWITGKFDSIAIRVTQHEPIKQLCDLFGSALISTSANLSGQSPALTTHAVISQFEQRLDGILDNDIGSLAKPTQIKDSLTGHILRF